MTNNILRQSQLITTYGPGAMIDLPDHSVIISGLGDWSYQGRERIEETRLVAKLQRILGVPSLSLWTPPRHEEGRGRSSPVRARIFPGWFIVKDSIPSPHNLQWRRQRLVQWAHLHKYRFIDDDGKRKKVVPVRFVCGCRLGHIDDLDWLIREKPHVPVLSGWRNVVPAQESEISMLFVTVVKNGHSMRPQGQWVSLVSAKGRGCGLVPMQGSNAVKTIDSS